MERPDDEILMMIDAIPYAGNKILEYIEYLEEIQTFYNGLSIHAD